MAGHDVLAVPLRAMVYHVQVTMLRERLMSMQSFMPSFRPLETGYPDLEPIPYTELTKLSSLYVTQSKSRIMVKSQTWVGTQ